MALEGYIPGDMKGLIPAPPKRPNLRPIPRPEQVDEGLEEALRLMQVQDQVQDGLEPKLVLIAVRQIGDEIMGRTTTASNTEMLS